MVNGPVEGRGSRRWPKRFLYSLLLAAVLVLAACSPAPGAQTGSIQVTVSGLTSGANIQVSGPSGFSSTITASATLENLAPGDYTLVAAPAGEFYVVSERTVEVAVTIGGASSASFAYARAFAFDAAADAALLSLDGSTEFTATLTDLHPDLTDVDVTLTAPAGWDLSLTGPWTGAAASSISTVATDTAAEFGANEFLFSVTGNIQGQALEHNVAVAVDLLPVVTNTSDDVADPQQGSLRYLIEHPRVEGQTITFDPAAAGGSQVIIELQDELVIGQSLNIEGLAEPANWVTLTPATGVTTRLAYVPQNAGGDLYEVTLSRLAFVDGTPPGGADGGAISSHADLTVSDSLFSENGARHGGAIFVAGGSLTATNVRFALNSASDRGGAVYANNATKAELLNSTFTENQASNGGAVMTGSGSPLPSDRVQVLIENSTFEDNHANSGAGAFMNYGNATIIGSHFESNTATSGGGAIRNHYRMTIDDTDIVDNEANQYGGILSDGILSMSNTQVSNNRALSGDGGGIYSGWAGGNYKIDDVDLKTLTIVTSQITGNTAAGNGAGIYNVQVLEITDSTIANNTAHGTKGGGGIFAVAVTPEAAPRNDDTQRGSITAIRSTFSGNDAQNGDGGAIAVEVESGAFSPTFAMLNSTVAGNSAHGNGGGIWVSNPYDGGLGTVGVTGHISFSTIANNESMTGYGGGIGTRYGDMTLRGNIVANNVMHNDTAAESQFDLYSYAGWAVSDGYNWFTVDPTNDLAEATSDTLGQPISLGSLQDNGGPTATMRPPFETLGAELDDVPLAECQDLADDPLTLDQRGLPRPGANTTCTRGAFEQQ